MIHSRANVQFVVCHIRVFIYIPLWWTRGVAVPSIPFVKSVWRLYRWYYVVVAATVDPCGTIAWKVAFTIMLWYELPITINDHNVIYSIIFEGPLQSSYYQRLSAMIWHGIKDSYYWILLHTNLFTWSNLRPCSCNRRTPACRCVGVEHSAVENE